MKVAARSIFALSITALALVPACQGTDVDIASPDDFFDGPGDVGSGVVVSVGSGTGIFGVCLAPPEDLYATLSLNGELIREKAKAGEVQGAEPITVDGVLGAITDTTFEVDACALVTCDQPALYGVKVTAGTTSLLLPPEGTFVRLTYIAETGGAFAVVLDNAPALEGMANPVDTTTHPWLEAMNGFVSGMPFSAAFTLTDRCFTEDGTLNARNMFVEAAGNPGERLEVRMGESVPWTITVGENTGSYDVANLASYAQGESAVSTLIVTRH